MAQVPGVRDLGPVGYKPLLHSAPFLHRLPVYPLPPPRSSNPNLPPATIFSLSCPALSQTPPAYGSSTSTGHCTPNAPSGILKERVSMYGSVSVRTTLPPALSPQTTSTGDTSRVDDISTRRYLRICDPPSVGGPT